MRDKILVSNIDISEKSRAANTLFHAFSEDPLISWIFENEKAYQEKGIAIFETWIKYAILYGKAFKTNHFESVAIRRKPGDVKFTLWRVFRSGILKTSKILGKESFERLMSFDDLATKEKQKNLGNRLFWYCWSVGTLPQYQHKGYASALMKHTFELARKDNLPCYLETSSERSKDVHLSKGYKVLSTFQLPNSNFTIYTMLKELEN